MNVRVARMPGGLIQVYSVPEGSTVQSCFQAAGMSIDPGYDIRVNGDDATPTTVVAEGATVLMVKKIKGNTKPKAKCCGCGCKATAKKVVAKKTVKAKKPAKKSAKK